MARAWGPSQEAETKERAEWIPAHENRFGVPILDLIRVTSQITAWSGNPRAAEMALSWDDSTSVHDVSLDCPAAESVACELRYDADPGLTDGWLFVPTTMEQKWVIAYRDGRIAMIRSWSGVVPLAGQARREGNELVIERIDIADRAFATFGEAVTTFDWMLRAHALGQKWPLPVSPRGAQKLEAAPLEAFTLFGNVAAYAATTWGPPRARPIRSISDLLIAVRSERLDRVAELAAAGAFLDGRGPVLGFTPLHIAAVKGSLPLTRVLLAHGANPNVLADRAASVLGTALVHNAPFDLMELLVAHGADPHVPNTEGFGLIHALAEVNRPEPLLWLLSLGLDLEARTRRGHTPLHIAAGRGNVEAIEALLDAGADANATDRSGRTAREVARAEGKTNAVEALSARYS
jgi:hypothetical protein